MTWHLSHQWAIELDTYNWTLKERKGNRWRAVSYHPTPEKLLRSLHQRVLRTKQPDADLIAHLEACLTVATACTEALQREIGARLGSAAKMTFSQAWPLLKKAG